MTPLTVSVKRLHPHAIIPRYMTAGAAGLDLCAALDQALHLAPGERRLVPTGIALAIPAGFEGQVRPRSGLALRQGLTMLNSPGTIDSDYRGEIGLIVVNHGEQEAVINPGDRVGQLVITPVVRAELVEVEELDATRRGSGGFGHTGSSGGS